MKAAARAGAAGVLSVLAVACANDAESAPTAEVVDSAGVQIVTYDLTRVPAPVFRVVADPDLEIGAEEGEPEYVFSRIADLAVANDGSVLVSDAVARELRVYSSEGTYRTTLGRLGEGPGEFATAPEIAGLAGDTVFAFDNRFSRITAFTMSGQLVGVTTFGAGTLDRPIALIRQEDGTYLSESRWVDPNGLSPAPHGPRLELDSIVIHRLDADGRLIDTVRVMPDRKRARIVQDRGGGVFSTMEAPTPYATQAFVRADGLRPILAHNDAFELELLSAIGAGSTRLRVRGAANPATAEEIRAHQEAVLLKEFGDGPIDPMVRRLNLDFLPDRLPAFANVIAADDGDIWVASSEYDLSGGHDWLVFSPEGEMRGLVHTPPNMRLFAVVQGRIVGVAYNDLDVPFVRRYPLRTPSDGASQG